MTEAERIEELECALRIVSGVLQAAGYWHPQIHDRAWRLKHGGEWIGTHDVSSALDLANVALETHVEVAP